MKAPDKIYMPNELLSEDWERHIEGEDTCYIRKNAMLEWVKENIERWNVLFGTTFTAMVKDKLNSL